MLNSLENNEMIWISNKATTVADTEISSTFKREYMHFGIRVIDAITNSSTINIYSAALLYTYTGGVYTQTYMIRPVVILEANTVLTESNGVYNIV